MDFPKRHVSPPTKNNFKKFSYLNSPNKNKNSDSTLNKFNSLDSTFINDYNYYDEIKKAFNFITFILHKKDDQIKSLKKKINDLQIQINKFATNYNISFRNSKDLTENNIHTKLNKQNSIKNLTVGIPIQSISNDSSCNSNCNSLYILNNNILIPKNNLNNRVKNFTNNYISINSQNSNSSKQITLPLRENYNIPKIDYSNNNNTQIFKQNNSKKEFMSPNSEKIKAKKNLCSENKNINFKNENFSYKMNNNTSSNKINKNNENSNFNSQGKINSIILNRNQNYCNSVNRKDINKIFNDENYISDEGNKSKNNSLSMINDNPKNEVKNYLREVRNKLDPEDFSRFIQYIKILTNSGNSREQKLGVIEEIKKIFGNENYNLFVKLENITQKKNL